MSYKHLTIKQRNNIELLLKEGYSMRKIAKKIGVNVSTVSREINRCKNKIYTTEETQANYLKKSKLKGRKYKITLELENTIIAKLKERWSPEQIVGRLLQGLISFKSIYNWIHKNVLQIDLSYLRRKGRSFSTQETRGKFNVGTCICKRPKEVMSREIFGHWELDTVVSSRGKSKGCLATFVERKTRFYIAIPMVNKSKFSMIKAVKALCSLLPNKAFKSFTSDRGKEFACYKEIEKMGIDFYFADPYSSWQRGSNENSNGLLREYYPKKTNLSNINLTELIQNLVQLNSRPRKCLNFATPFEALIHEINLLS